MVYRTEGKACKNVKANSNNVTSTLLSHFCFRFRFRLRFRFKEIRNKINMDMYALGALRTC
jgi:hypothetical protein